VHPETLFSSGYIHLKSTLEKRIKSPIMDGNFKFRAIPNDMVHNNIMQMYQHCTFGFSVREIKKSIERAKEINPNTICINEYRRFLVFCKLFIGQFPKSRKFLMWVSKNLLTYNSQIKYYEEIEDFHHQRYCTGKDRKTLIPLSQEKYEWCKFLENEDDAYRFFMPRNGLPFWEVRINQHKSDKMKLCDLDPPSVDLQKEFRSKIRNLLDKYKPKDLQIPNPIDGIRVDSNKYADGRLVREDHEEPSTVYSEFHYQEFMTGPHCVRQVWLPSWKYKYNSNMWNCILKQILNNIPYSCNEKGFKQVGDILFSRFERGESYTTFDLKGCGLQFPREYVMIVLDEISYVYPDLELTNLCEETRYLFNNISISGYTDNLYKPKRGVGLGYYTGAMSLAMFAIMEDIGILAAFADDMLINTKNYDMCVQASEYFQMLTNTKKSGKTYIDSFFFMNVGFIFYEEDYYINYYQIDNEPLAALTTKRHHFQRKEIISFLDMSEMNPLMAAYHAELCFGYEFYRSDYLAPIVSGGPFAVRPNDIIKTDRIFLDHKPQPMQSADFGKFPEVLKRKPYYAQFTGNGSYANYVHKFRKMKWKNRRVIDPLVELNTNFIKYEEGLEDLEEVYEGIPIWFDQMLSERYGFQFGAASNGFDPDKLSIMTLSNKNFKSIRDLTLGVKRKNLVTEYVCTNKELEEIKIVSNAYLINRESVRCRDLNNEEVTIPQQRFNDPLNEEDQIEEFDDEFLDDYYEDIEPSSSESDYH
jgi:hypothetical protein